MSINKRSRMRNGMTMIETGLSLAILSVVILTTFNYLRSTKRDVLIQREIDFRAVFGDGIKKSFEEILDAYEPICSSITSDAQTKWGWGHSQCDGTSPFPTYLASEQIRYNLELSSLSASEKLRLEDAIVGAFSPYCSLSSVGANNIDLRCPTMTNLVYDLGSGSVAAAHTLGQDIDPSIIPKATMTISRKEGDGSITTVDTNIPLLDLYQKRRQFSLEKFNLIRNIAKTYYNNQLSLEVANAPSTGLNSIDDEFVWWGWKMFGDNTSDVLGSICNTGGTDICSNLNTNNIWRSSLSGNGLYMRRLSQNMLNGDTRMSVDGFGNQVVFYPMMSQCANNDISTCSTTAPPVPQKGYYNIMRPPYVSVLYIDSFKDKTVVAPSYGRAYISY